MAIPLSLLVLQLAGPALGAASQAGEWTQDDTLSVMESIAQQPTAKESDNKWFLDFLFPPKKRSKNDKSRQHSKPKQPQLHTSGNPPNNKSSSSSSSSSSSEARMMSAGDVKREAIFAWEAYMNKAWGWDELDPQNGKGHNWYSGHSFVLTAIDALDTFIIMGLDKQAAEAKKLIQDKLTFNQDVAVSVFEFGIRCVGGLISAAELRGVENEPKLVRLAVDLADRLLKAFNTPTGVPMPMVNLKTGETSFYSYEYGCTDPASAGSLILEFGKLSKITGNSTYMTAAKKAMAAIGSTRSKINLIPKSFDIQKLTQCEFTTGIGGQLDSYFEYLKKCAVLFGDGDCKRDWRIMSTAINKHQLDTDEKGRLWYTDVDYQTGAKTQSQFSALAAFYPTVLALDNQLSIAEKIQHSSDEMWKTYGLEPENYDYSTGKGINKNYLLRPEIMESAYYLLQITGDERYKRMISRYFSDIVAKCKCDTEQCKGFVHYDVGQKSQISGAMDSYFFAETLKYAYLGLAYETGDGSKNHHHDQHTKFGGGFRFEDFVFNTEAHPFKCNGCLKSTVERGRHYHRSKTPAERDAIEHPKRKPTTTTANTRTHTTSTSTANTKVHHHRRGVAGKRGNGDSDASQSHHYHHPHEHVVHPVDMAYIFGGADVVYDFKSKHHNNHDDHHHGSTHEQGLRSRDGGNGDDDMAMEGLMYEIKESKEVLRDFYRQPFDPSLFE